MLSKLSIGRIVRSRPALAGISTISKMMARAGTFLIIAPLIGPAKQGVVVVTSAWSAVIVLIVAYGLQVRVLREMASKPERSRAVAKSDLKAMAGLTLPAVVAAIGVAAFILPKDEHLVFAAIFLGFLCSVVGDYCSSALRAVDDFSHETIVAVSSAVLQMVLTVGAALLFKSLIILALALLLARVVFAGASLAVLFHHRSLRNSTETASAPIRATLPSAFPYFVDGSLSVLLSQLDILLLNWLVNRDAIGIYSAGSRLVQLILVVPWVATNIMVPAIARAADDAQTFKAQIARLRLGLAVLTACSAAGLLICGPIFTTFALGPRYAALNGLWPGLAAMVAARFFESYFGIVMTALGLMKRRVFVQMAAVMAICAGGFLLVPHLGIHAMIMVIGLTYCGIGSYYAYTLSRIGKLSFRPAALGGTAVAIAMIAATVFGARS